MKGHKRQTGRGLKSMTYPRLSTAIGTYISHILVHKSEWYEKGQKSQLKYWNRQLGHLRVNEITPEMAILPDRSAATKNRYATALKCALNQYGLNLKLERFKEPERIRFLSDDERIRLLEACRKSRSKVLYPVIILALSTGMRRGEILKLTWDRVDLARRLIYLVETKNGEKRMIPIGGHALELICNLPRTSKYVFPSRDGSYHRDMNYYWYPVLKESGIKGFRFHDLRHTAASYLAMNGTPLLDISMILGHQDISTTMKYAHLSTEHLRGTLKSLNDMMFS